MGRGWLSPIAAISLMGALGSFAQPAAAFTDLTLGELRSLCNSDFQSDQRACTYFIYGAASGLVLGSGKAAEYCLPKNLTIHDLIDATDDELKKSALLDVNDLAAESFVAATINRHFPCRPK